MHSVQGEEKEEGSSARETLPIMHESIRKHRRRGRRGRDEGRPPHQSFPSPMASICAFAWMPTRVHILGNRKFHHGGPQPLNCGTNDFKKLLVRHQLVALQWTRLGLGGDLHTKRAMGEKEEWKAKAPLPSRSPDRASEQCLPSAESVASSPLLVRER